MSPMVYLTMITLISSAVMIIQGFGFTSIYGGRGDYYLLTARPMDFGNFSFDMIADYYYETYTDIDTVYNDTFEDRRHFGNGWFTLAFSALPYTEIYANGVGFFHYDEKSEHIQIPVQLRKDAYVFGKKGFGGGIKVGFPVLRARGLAFAAYLGGKAGIMTSFKPPADYDTLTNRGFPPFDYHNPDYDFRFLTTLEFGALGLNFNGGYLNRGSNRGTGQPRSDLGVYGVGLDLNVRNRTWLFGETFSLGDSSFYTAGLKLGVGSSLSFDLFIERGLTDPDFWKLAAGFTVFSTVPAKPKRAIAYITGHVADAQSGAAVVAIISFPGSDVKSTMTNPDGSYRIGLPAGAYMVLAQASGYRSKERPITVKAGSEIIFDMVLAKSRGYTSEPVGRITGQIFDEREEPIEGEVEILGADIKEVKTKNGRFSFDVAPGRYELAAHAPGYRSYGKVIYVKEEGEEVKADIHLRDEAVSLPSGFGKISGFIRDKENETPVTAEVSAGGVVASTDNMGYYEIQIAAGSPQIRAEADGYVVAKRIVEVEKGSDIVLDFFLSRKKPTGVIIGSVYKSATMEPLYAQVIADGRDKKVVNTNPKTGIFRIETSPGTYLVSVLAGDIQTPQAKVLLDENEIEVLTFYIAKPEKTKQTKPTVEVPSFEPVYFDYGNTYYRYEYMDRLVQVANYLVQNQDKRVEIRGFTDSVGPDFQNLILSQHRAETVRDFLISQGVEPSRIFARGYGESYPVGDNRTLYGRELNRRVEFRFLP